MSIYRVRLHKHLQYANTSNVWQTDTSSGHAKIVWNQQLDQADDQAVNSRLLVQRQEMHGSQKCCGKLTELTVDDMQLIACW